MKYNCEIILGYALMFFVYLLVVIFGFERVKKLGDWLLTRGKEDNL